MFLQRYWVTVRGIPSSFSMKYWPSTPFSDTAYQMVTRSLYSGFWTITSGLSKPRERVVWRLMKPSKWMWLSSENHTLSKKSGSSYTMAKNRAQYSILRCLSCSANLCPTCIRYGNPPKSLNNRWSDVLLMFKFRDVRRRLWFTDYNTWLRTRPWFSFADTVPGLQDFPFRWYNTLPVLRNFVTIDSITVLLGAGLLKCYRCCCCSATNFKLGPPW